MKYIKYILIILLFSISAYAADIKPESMLGRWSLVYARNYGYEFIFQKNYRVTCILYTGNSALVFKGIYSIEPGNKLRINISEMKNDTANARNPNIYSGFNKAVSSHFLFKTELSANNRTMIIKPSEIFIDGNNSDGYFEPIIKLERK